MDPREDARGDRRPQLAAARNPSPMLELLFDFEYVRGSERLGLLQCVADIGGLQYLDTAVDHPKLDRNTVCGPVRRLDAGCSLAGAAASLSPAGSFLAHGRATIVGISSLGYRSQASSKSNALLLQQPVQRRVANPKSRPEFGRRRVLVRIQSNNVTLLIGS
jgi:hypothetical protein